MRRGRASPTGPSLCSPALQVSRQQPRLDSKGAFTEPAQKPVPDPERFDAGPAGRVRRAAEDWVLYVAAGVASVPYLNARTELIPRWGEWYASDLNPPVLLQLRAWFSGKLAPAAHPVGDWYDYVWGRGGMHTNFGLGLPILGIPFHLVARLLGAPGFPDHLRFLILHAITMALLTRALHRLSRGEPYALVSSAGVSAFVLAFPAFVGLIAARFQVYEQTIAVGALWTILLLTGVLVLMERSTTPRLVMVCAAAALTVFFRPPLAAYGLTTVVLATLIARSRGLGSRGLLAGVATAALVATLYLASNFVRFGSPWEAGYANIVSQPAVNRLTRWGIEYEKTPILTASKEMFATLFFLEPVATPIMTVAPTSLPASVAPYAVGERWREYYSPAYDLWVFVAWVSTVAAVAWRIVRKRLWRRDRDLGGEVATVLGVWALPPSLALFVFYAKAANLVTRYLVDFYPAFAAVMVCVAMVVVDIVRERAPRAVALAHVAIAGVAVLYLSGRDGWPQHLSRPVTAAALEGRLAMIEAESAQQPIPSGHVQSTDPRGSDPVFGHLGQWRYDGLFESGMLFAFPRSPCIAFALHPAANNGWGQQENEALAGLRVDADFDALRSCGAPTDEGESRRVTFCEPTSPPFVLDGMRLYVVASLDDKRRPIDRLRITRIDAAPACRPLIAQER
jgi:hypothetical protein